MKSATSSYNHQFVLNKPSSKKNEHHLVEEFYELLGATNNFSDFIKNGLLDGICFWDLNNKENAWFDDNFWMQLGYDEENLPNDYTSWLKHIFEEDKISLFEGIQNSLDNVSQPFKQSLRFKHIDGTTIYFKSRNFVIADDNNNPVKLVGTLHNVTDISKDFKGDSIKEKWIKQKKNLDNYFHIISHDFKEPLNSILIFLHLLEEDYSNVLEDKGKKYLHFIKDAVEKTTSLVRSSLNFSSIALSDSVEEIDCNEMVNGILKDMDAIIKRKNAKIELKHLPKVQGYRMELKSIFQNLISNALKFQKPGNNPQIKIESRKATGWVFEITDNGIGIEEKNLKKVFNFGFKSDYSNEFSGNTIGLAQCQTIAALHNGYIWLESEKDKGTKISFSVNLS